MSEAAKLTGPDLQQGVPATDVVDGQMLLGHAHGEAVILARRGDAVYAVGATCTHYSGPLADGILVGDEVRCPYHHACFDLRTGEAVGPPALNPIPCFAVEKQGDRLFVGARLAPQKKALPSSAAQVASVVTSVVIVGAGAAGNAAAEQLRLIGYTGQVTLIGAETTLPVDRPNLSKDYLAGTAQEEWIPLRSREDYQQRSIDLLLGTRVTRLDTKTKQLTLSDGKTLSYGALILATGAEPVRLSTPGAELPHVHVLRSFADSRAIIAAAGSAKRVVVIGASFIGLEVAASLRARGLEVHVVAPEARPLEKILGPELGDFVRALHEEHGVSFHLGQTVATIDATSVTLSGGAVLPADLVVTGVGVRPSLQLAEQAGLTVDKGVVVDRHLQTSAPGVYAAGDIARWPDPHSGQSLRVEHWVVAERQGQAAARNAVGLPTPYTHVPFFWSQHYDVPIAYVGHAARWDRIEIAGSLENKSCFVAYRDGGRIVAVATIYLDKESLLAEAALARDDQAALEALLEAARG